MHLTCPKCKYEWEYKGNFWRTNCQACRKKGICTIIKTGLPTPWSKEAVRSSKRSNESTASISDDIMHGNILDALEKANIDPFNNNGKLSKDFIPLLLKDDELKLAFSKYCEQKKKQPLWVVKKAITLFLKGEGLYEK